MSRWSIALAQMVLLVCLFFSKVARAAPTGQANPVDSLGVVTGTALDGDFPTDVHFYVGQVGPGDQGFVGQVRANQGTHVFSFALPSTYFDGVSHPLWVYAVSHNGVTPLLQAISFTLTTGPVGKIESIDPFSGRVRGWARFPHAGTAPISVDVYVDRPPTRTDYSGYLSAQSGLARAPRPDLNVLYRDDPERHGFTFVLPTRLFDNGPHTLYVYAIGGSNPPLGGSGMQFTLPPNPIIGSISSVVTEGGTNNLTIKGWACQVGQPANIPVSVYAGVSAYFSDGSPLSGTLVPSTYTTSASLPAVNSQCGAGSNHNFLITVTDADRKKYQGLPLFVHGERVTGTSMNAMLDYSGTYFFPLDTKLSGRLLPGVPSVYATPVMLEGLLDPTNSNQIAPAVANSLVWAAIKSRADAALSPSVPLVGPYYGSTCLPTKEDDPSVPANLSFAKSIENDLYDLPYLAIACHLMGGNYCTNGVQRLSAWAKPWAPPPGAPQTQPPLDPQCWAKMPSTLRAGVQLYCPKAIDEDHDEATQAGLTIARYLGQIVESYQLLAPYMSGSDRAAVVSWVLDLGYTIKKSSMGWNNALPEEGPNNHLQWHNYGMALAGLLGGDNDLVTFALTDPANSQTYAGVSRARNYYGNVTDAIREVGNTSNIFRTGYDGPSAVGPSSPGQCSIALSTGEVWDRYRHVVDPPKRQVGFYYSLFGLMPMVYTAHLANSNGLTNNRTSLMSFVDPNDVDARGAWPSLLNALDFYSYVIVDTLQPTNATRPTIHNTSYATTDCLKYLPYAGESACAPSDLGAFIVGTPYVAHNAPTLASRAKFGAHLSSQTVLSQVQAAQHLCRDLLSPGDYTAWDEALRDGMPQAYLLLVNQQYQ